MGRPALSVSDPVAVAAERLTDEWRDRYEPSVDEAWWHFSPIDAAPLAQQGWKIHVSASPSTAVETLRRVAPVVMPLGLRWKVARSVDQLCRLCTPPSPVSQVGKFVTVYVPNEHALPMLAERLHLATCHIDGDAPIVPSDRRYTRHSKVYLRYGGFEARVTYAGSDQIREWYLVDPSGRREVDRRAPGRYRPAWAPEPTLPPLPAPRPRRPGPGLFGRGIEVFRVFAQSARGIVALGTWEGRRVVVKEARIGTCPDLAGRDARDQLRNEWQLLQHLSGTGLAPEPLDFFLEEDNAYLVEELLPGETLRRAVERANYLDRPDARQLRETCRAVADLVTGLCERGVRIRDLTPNNVMLHEGRCTAIDLELWELAGSPEPAFFGWTPGYGTPMDSGAHDTTEVDFAFAAVIFFVLTGIDPYVAPSVEIAQRLDAMLGAFGPDDTDALSSELDLVRDRLGSSPPGPALIQRAAIAPDADRVTEDAVEAGRELVRRTEWDRAQWPWPSALASRTYHPACFQAGTAGIARYYLDLWQATRDREWLRHAADLLDWTFTRVPYVRGQTPPGLHFGVAALPWLATELAAVVDADRAPALRERAARLADALAGDETVSWDITHGWAGIGLAVLGTSLAMGDEARARATNRLAHRVLNAAEDADGLRVWRRDGTYAYGFAHGSAGIGHFLLTAGCVTDDRDLRDAALGIARGLVPRGVPAAGGAGLSWPISPTSTVPPWTHWCNGSAGVGAFLLSAATTGGDDELADAARRAGRSIARGRAFGSTNRCHGLAGDGDYLLDLAEAGHGEEFVEGARRAGRKLEALMFRDRGVWKWPNEGGDGAPRPAYMLGYLGVHAFRLRLAALLPQAPLTIPLPGRAT